MSLDAFGGVLVNSPSELTVQPLLAPPSDFVTQTAFLPGPPTEITLDEDDVFQCGKCKKVFTSFQLFMFHKKEHQLSSSGSKFFGVGMALALDGGLGGNLGDSSLVNQEVELRGSTVSQLVHNQCCQEIPITENIKECLGSNSQQVSSDVLEYSTLCETPFDELHSDISQPMMLGDPDPLNFSIEQTALNIHSSDQLPETGYVPSSMSDIQSNILPDKLIQHEDCETSCDQVWHLSQKDDSSSLNFGSTGFSEEQPLFMDGKKFNVSNGKKIVQSIQYSNDDLMPEVPYSSDKEVFINDTSSIRVQEVMAESESQGILPPGEFFSKSNMDYMSSSDLLTEFEKVSRHALVDSQMVEPVTVLEVEMPLLTSVQLQTPLMDSTVLHSDIPALLPIGDQNIEEEHHHVKKEALHGDLSPVVSPKTCQAQQTVIPPESVVSGEEILLHGKTLSRHVASLLKGSCSDKYRKELGRDYNRAALSGKTSKIKDPCTKIPKYSSKSLDENCEPTTNNIGTSSCVQNFCKESSLKKSCKQKSKPSGTVAKKAKGTKTLKNQKSSKVSTLTPHSQRQNSNYLGSPTAVLTLPLDTVQPFVSGIKHSLPADYGGRKKLKESSWEPRVLKLTCEFCEKKFAKQFDLQQHLRSHTGEKPFQCIVCGRAFAQKSNVTKHIRTHKVWPKGVFTLPKNFLQKVEPNKIGSGQNLGVHQEKAETNSDLIKMEVHNHTDSKSSSDCDTSDNEPLNVGQNKKRGRKCAPPETADEYIIDNSYICQFCDSSFITYFELKTHLKVHQDEKVYFCNQKGCKQTFSDLSSFVDHVQMHDSHEATYRCHVCKEMFCSLADLGTHQYTHTSVEKTTPKRSAFKCPECRSRFVSPEALDHHMMTATHKHPCPECKREFTCERNLRRHLTAHSTVCPYICKECGKGFKTEGYLNAHLTMHSKDKPFACSQCPAKFARKDRLSRHFLIHQESKRIKCPFHMHLNCHRVFTRKDKLKLHVFTHTDHKHLNCPTCKREFLNFSWSKKWQGSSSMITNASHSSYEESKNSKDAIDNEEDKPGEPPNSVESVGRESHDDIFEATVDACQGDSPLDSTCYLTSENLPTIEIIVMPLPLSIS